MKLKKILASIICVAMVFGTMGITVFADDSTLRSDVNGVLALNKVEAENNYNVNGYSAQIFSVTFGNVPKFNTNLTVKLYHDDEMLSTTNVADKYLGVLSGNVSAVVIYSGDPEVSSWTTEINAPWTIDRAPNKIVVDVDGEETVFDNFEIAAYGKFEQFKWDELENIPAVAKIGDRCFATLQAAISAAQSGDVIDLVGNTIEFAGKNNCIWIEGDITIQNGTIDLNDAEFGGNSIFYIGEGDKITFKNVDFKGDGYSSAYGVIYTQNGEITVEDCSFELKNEKHSAGAIIKGNNPSVDKATINNCTFVLENPCSVMKNITIDMTDTTINAGITDPTLVAGELKNHAFRNIYGTISSSTISAEGFESGIKNSNSQTLTVDGTSVITLKENDYNLVLTANTTLNVAETAVVSTQTALADDDTTVICDDTEVSGTQKSGGAVTSGNTEQKWCAYKFEISPKGNNITVTIDADGKESKSATKVIANIENTPIIIGVTAIGADNLASIAVATN